MCKITGHRTSAPRRVADWLADPLTVELHRQVPGVQTPDSVARAYFFFHISFFFFSLFSLAEFKGEFKGGERRGVRRGTGMGIGVVIEVGTCVIRGVVKEGS